MSAEQVKRLREDLARAEAERDRLQAELNTANAELEDAHQFERDARQVEADRDRLQAVVDAYQDDLSRNSTEGAPHEATGTGVLLPVSTRSADGGPVTPSTPAPQPETPNTGGTPDE